MRKNNEAKVAVSVPKCSRSISVRRFIAAFAGKEGIENATPSWSRPSFCFMFLSLLLASGCYSQSCTSQTDAQHIVQLNNPSKACRIATRGSLDSGRYLDDPFLGRSWSLVSDPSHPERPGRWQLNRAPELSRHRRSYRTVSAARSIVTEKGTGVRGIAGKNFDIRAGDRIALTQSTPEVEARFLAVALEPAQIGEQFKVRLLTTRGWPSLSRVVLARALEPGEAVWVGREELRP